MTPPTNKGQKFTPQPLTRAEVGTLLGACSTRSHSGVRLRAIIAVMYGTGLRLAETLALVPADLDLAEGLVRVRNGKGGKSRVVGIDSFSQAILQAWLDRRSSQKLTGKHPVFAAYAEGHHGKPLAARYVRASLARMGVKAQIGKRVHPHGLRHSHAFSAVMDGTPVTAIQRQLGHTSLAITDRYVGHLAPMQVVEMFRNRNPYSVAS